MNYYSTNKNAPLVSFKEAVIKGLAPDKGLYFPNMIQPLEKDFFDHIEYFSNHEIAYQVIKQFVGDEIPALELKNIIAETLNFDFPLLPIEKNISVLELFHGPTMAFKDVGARFMARCFRYFNDKKNSSKATVLVATSGDTGSAVANGFLGIEGVEVVILYPSKKVSPIQEKQLTTLGQNISALEVQGTFDDCQQMVKKAFLDTELMLVKNMTSANSINIARWLPQMFYYFFAYKQLKNKNKNFVFSVPSGNFGNICAGLLAKKLGLPVKKLIASTNANDLVPIYLNTGVYSPKQTIQTISNAMDVSDPSNFTRILELYNQDATQLKKQLISYSFSDKETKKAIKKLNDQSNYISDPHGAIGYLGLKKYISSKKKIQGIYLETAHPVKFSGIVSTIIDQTIPLPEQLKEIINKEKISIQIKDYSDFKSFLLK